MAQYPWLRASMSRRQWESRESWDLRTWEVATLLLGQRLGEPNGMGIPIPSPDACQGAGRGAGARDGALVTALVTLHTPDRRRLTRASATIHARIVPETPMVRPGPFAGTHLHAAGPSPPVGVQRDRVPPGAQKEEQLTRV